MYTRAALLSYVSSEHAGLLTEAGIAAVDTQAGIKSVLDKTFRALGVGQSDLSTAAVDDPLTAPLEAAADYYTYNRLATIFARWVSVSKSVGGASVSKDRSTIYQQVVAELARLKKICDGWGLIVEPPTVAVFSINLDFLEPQGAG